MAQISLTAITTTWQEFSPTASTVYRMQNRGPETIIAQEGDTAPTEGDIAGIMVEPGKTLVYEQGTAAALYLRTLRGNASINISTEE